MRLYLPFLTLTVLSCGLFAQNLVPNPSFETLGASPPCSWISTTGQFAGAVTNWSMPSGGTTDIFHTSAAVSCYAHPQSTHGAAVGQQAPRTGGVHSAIFTHGDGCSFNANYREYLQVPLTTPLTTGEDYDIEFFISMADNSRYATNNFGAFFKTSFTFTTSCYVLNQTPQFNHSNVVTNKTGWTRIAGTVTATGAWRYLILGNFFDDASTTTIHVGGTLDNTRYFIDDISVAPAILLPAAELDLLGERGADGRVDLHWNQPEELETSEYQVQRSRDGMAWESLDLVSGKANHTDLAWRDEFPPAGEILYRVRYTDGDGKHFSSNVMRFGGENAFPYRVQIANHPVPAGQPVQLRIGGADDSPAQVEIHDLTGRKVWLREGMTLRELDGYTLPAGLLEPNLYVIRLSTAKGHLSRKLVVR